MKRSILGGAVALLLAQQAWAAPGLSLQLQLVSRSEQADHFLSQYEITVTNTGTVSLASIAMTPSHPELGESAHGINQILIGQLAAGAQYVAYWDLKTSGSQEYALEGKSIHFDVSAVNSVGETLSMPLFTEEQPLP